MSLKETRELYINKQISKAEYINKMHEFHLLQFEYADFLSQTDICKITLEGGKMIMTSGATSYHPGGISFYCDRIDNRETPIETFNFGTYEPEDSAMLYALIEKNYTVLDIGGNIGWYTNHIAAILSDGKVFGIEPIPETFAKLSNNVALNGFGNIKLENFAFSDKKDKIKFYYSPLMPGASSAANITENSEIQELECITNTVDAYVEENNIDKIDFIKCDVEGAEFMVFKGAKDILSQHKPVVFAEMLRKWAAKFGYHPNDMIAYFNTLGYNCYVTDKDKLKAIRIVDEHTVETNYFFLHPGAHAEKINKLVV
ncbi:FkbM family methyltransferase [Mucilaginibacter agri]|uniref:FkbM family methyltransferase n=1 Tax=Mucilaginibacter agri TaxID=2695265 RepID=A0A966DUS5_9SPHI|nr:FkbM family methyltransferase [Mucilaginibacter agri]NCD70751.1 FkbM family methyltransferase [Mucilaginibacter agri]